LGAEPTVTGWLVPPGGMLPVSIDRSSRRTRCTCVSMLRHTTVRPAGIVAGLGEKDCAPLAPTMLITSGGVSLPPPAGGVGPDGFGDPPLFDPPHPHTRQSDNATPKARAPTCM